MREGGAHEGERREWEGRDKKGKGRGIGQRDSGG